MDLVTEIVRKCKAGYPVLFVVTSEDGRTKLDTKTAAQALGRSFYYWSSGRGLFSVDGKSESSIGDSDRWDLVIRFLTEQGASPIIKDKSVVLLRTFHHFLEEPDVQAAILDAIPIFKARQKTLIITSPGTKIPPELEKEMGLIEAELPGPEYVNRAIDGMMRASKWPEDKWPDAKKREQICKAVSGLTINEIEDVLSLSLVDTKERGVEDRWDVQMMIREKCQAIRREGMLEYVEVSPESKDKIGGMEAFKEWTDRNVLALTPEAKAAGVDDPRGCVLVGIAGTGKSQLGKYVAAAGKLPLLRLDVGAVFGSLVGQSEENLRRALHRVEAVAPCVLMVDEVDKAFSNVGSGGDSGTSSRVFGHFLTWMQERKKPVFVLVTANNLTGLPPEFTRKGRFDEIWSVLLPKKVSRKEIFDIHIRSRKRGHLIDKKILNLDDLADQTKGFTGAEIEAVVKEAIKSAFFHKKDLNLLDLTDAIRNTVPLSKSMKSVIESQIDWGKNRARLVESLEDDDQQFYGRAVEAQ